MGTVCTSFNFMNSGTHQRSIAFPLGWHHYPYMELGNVLAARSAVLALLAWAMGGFPVLEQPLRSMMTALPAWQSVVAYFDEAECSGWIGQRLKLNHVNMAAFNAATLKPTALYSTESFDPLMNMNVPPKNKRPKPQAPTTYQCPGFTNVRWGFCKHVSTVSGCFKGQHVRPRYEDARGRKKVVGGSGLKQTQLYTPEFGRALASWWASHGPTSTGTGWFSGLSSNLKSLDKI